VKLVVVKQPNPRITARDRNGLKGAIRRVFSRSELRKQVIEASIIPNHVDASRPRVKTWCRCTLCKTPTPKSYMVVDHITPVVKIGDSFEAMGADALINNIWCDPVNLQAICDDPCHLAKSKLEAKERREYKKRNKK
jgi:5-methylcytosine-specific restriction endonuclease McrA